MHIHILGICGTFMGSLAQLAVAKGLKVTGCDANVYPPMSDQLTAAGIELIEGYELSQMDLQPDLWVIGNAMSRGNPIVEAILNSGLPYTSGPAFLAEHILPGKWVMAVAGTHGKTTTSSMLAWVLEYAGFNPGFLIGGVPANFGFSAQLGEGDFFVIEADEYDSAFFDKRSKFVHYHPRTLLVNNLEFDHADIFEDLAAIQKQFHHLVRTVPADGQILVPSAEKSVQDVIDMGCWTPVQSIGGGGDWTANLVHQDASEFDVLFEDELQGRVSWTQFGQHSLANGLGVIAAARSVGISPAVAIEALSAFKGVKRRMEIIASTASSVIYDDFAHHPTAIETTLSGLRKRVGDARVVAVIEPRSNTMKMGVHQDQLARSASEADQVYWYQAPGAGWSLTEAIGSAEGQCVQSDFASLLSKLHEEAQRGAHIVIMSNGGFQGIHGKLVALLETDITATK